MIDELENSAKAIGINDLVHQIVFLVVNKEDYKSAAKIMLEHHITLEELKDRTMKLTSCSLAKLADEILENK